MAVREMKRQSCVFSWLEGRPMVVSRQVMQPQKGVLEFYMFSYGLVCFICVLVIFHVLYVCVFQTFS